MVEDLQNLVDAVNVWPTILWALLLFSLAPQLLMQLAVLLYPQDHPRRTEHLAELRAVPRWQRPFWVAETAVSAVFEAVPLRVTRHRACKRVRLRGRYYLNARFYWQMTLSITGIATTRGVVDLVRFGAVTWDWIIFMLGFGLLFLMAVRIVDWTVRRISNQP